METEKINHSRIIAEAIELLREQGLERLSMRELAKRLSIRAPTLYWYFPDKTAILRAIVKDVITRVFADIPPSESWQDWMRGFGTTLWRVNNEMPYTTLLIQSQGVSDAEVFELVIGLIDAQMVRFGLPQATYMRVHSDLQAYVLGWSIFSHSEVAAEVGRVVDIESAVSEGVDMIVSGWAFRLHSAAG